MATMIKPSLNCHFFRKISKLGKSQLKMACLFFDSHCSPLDLPGEPEQTAEPGQEVAAVHEPDFGVLVRLEDDLEAASNVPLVHCRHCNNLFESPGHSLLPEKFKKQ